MSIRFEVKSKNKSKTASFDIGYITFFKFRQTLATMVDEMAGYVYGRYIRSQFTFLPDSILKVSPSEWGYFKLKIPPVLQKFLLASDCDGKLTSTECNKLYSVLTKAVGKTDKTKLDKNSYSYSMIFPNVFYMQRNTKLTLYGIDSCFWFNSSMTLKGLL